VVSTAVSTSTHTFARPACSARVLRSAGSTPTRTRTLIASSPKEILLLHGPIRVMNSGDASLPTVTVHAALGAVLLDRGTV